MVIVIFAIPVVTEMVEHSLLGQLVIVTIAVSSAVFVVYDVNCGTIDVSVSETTVEAVIPFTSRDLESVVDLEVLILEPDSIDDSVDDSISLLLVSEEDWVKEIMLERVYELEVDDSDP